MFESFDESFDFFIFHLNEIEIKLIKIDRLFRILSWYDF